MHLKDKGRLAHADEALVQLMQLGSELHRFLTLPQFSNARHRVTKAGREEASCTAHVSFLLYETVLVTRMTRLTQLVEDLKRSGLALPEAIRFRRWEQILCGAVEELRNYKIYRTPQALRSFAWIFTAFLPPLYGPQFARLARDAENLALGIVFGLLSSLTLTVLFVASSMLEDPFVVHLAMDGIGELQFPLIFLRSRSVFFCLFCQRTLGGYCQTHVSIVHLFLQKSVIV